MPLRDVLIDQERRFWDAAGDGEFYRANMSDDGICLLAVGPMNKDATIKAIARAEPWQTYDFDDVEVRQLGDGYAMLTYLVRANRGDGDDYAAVVSTLYTHDESAWKLLTHQQTPLQSP